jgi:hypothetical protein
VEFLVGAVVVVVVVELGQQGLEVGEGVGGWVGS